MQDKKSLIADTIHGTIMLSEFEKDIMTTTLFNRLHGICQNSTAYMTFPTNRTRRLEHSFGCMYLCGEMFYSSICNTESNIIEDFFQNVREEIEEIVKQVSHTDEGVPYKNKVGQRFKYFGKQYEKLVIEGGLFNYKIPANVNNDIRKDYVLIFEGIRVAAMLHDIGHPPFSHISENALNIIYADIESKAEENRTKAEKEFFDILDGKVGENHQLHEELGVSIAKELLLSAISNISEAEVINEIIYEKQVYQILVSEIALRILTERTAFFKNLHTIIDGTLDGDRLDYVSRDPQNSGFDLGKTEYERIVSKMKLCKKKGVFLFCPNISSIKAVEDFLIRRWNLYKNIVYHHRVVKTDYLLQNVIVEIAKEYFNDHSRGNVQGEMYDDYILPYDISGLWKANRKLPANKEMIYAISQWDDTWLLTILKKSYFGTYINQSGTLHNQLEELLTNKKHYYSLVKRKEEFEQIDRAAAKVIAEHEDEINVIINELQEQTKEVSSDNLQFDIAGYLNEIKNAVNLAKEIDNDANGHNGFVLCKIQKKLFVIDSFSTILDDMLDRMELTKDEMFYAIKELKTGTSKSLYFDKGDGEVVSLNRISSIENVLREDQKFSPFFFLYLSIEKGVHLNFTDERAKVGRAIGESIIDSIIKKLDGFKRI